MTTKTPVLITFWNRPESVDRFKNLFEDSSRTFFLWADGLPANSSPTKSISILHTHSELASVGNLYPNVHVFVQPSHLGLRAGIPSAISWAFSHTKYLLILEDDVVPSLAGLHFIDHAIDSKYLDPSSPFGVVTLNNVAPDSVLRSTHSSYRVTIFPHCWGWATSAYHWSLYSEDVLSPASFTRIKSNLPISLLSDQSFRWYWFKVHADLVSQKLNSWAFIWTFTLWLHSLKTLSPPCNLISYYGLTDEATHTSGSKYLFPWIRNDESDTLPSDIFFQLPNIYSALDNYCAQYDLDIFRHAFFSALVYSNISQNSAQSLPHFQTNE